MCSQVRTHTRAASPVGGRGLAFSAHLSRASWPQPLCTPAWSDGYEFAWTLLVQLPACPRFYRKNKVRSLEGHSQGRLMLPGRNKGRDPWFSCGSFTPAGKIFWLLHSSDCGI